MSAKLLMMTGEACQFGRCSLRLRGRRTALGGEVRRGADGLLLLLAIDGVDVHLFGHGLESERRWMSREREREQAEAVVCSFSTPPPKLGKPACLGEGTCVPHLRRQPNNAGRGLDIKGSLSRCIPSTRERNKPFLSQPFDQSALSNSASSLPIAKRQRLTPSSTLANSYSPSASRLLPRISNSALPPPRLVSVALGSSHAIPVVDEDASCVTCRSSNSPALPFANNSAPSSHTM